MKTNQNTQQSHKRGGFSMVEVLVASTILIVIVMMLGMLFQQTSLSWRVGVKRADGFTQVRAAIGAIQRDAAAAIDARSIPQALKSKLGGGQQMFNGSLKFYTLTGATAYDQSKNLMVMRALKYVTYETSGNRTEETLTPDGNITTPQANVLPSAGRLGNTSSTTLKNFDAYYGTGSDLDPDGLPLYITFEAEVTASGANLDIGAASAGPDRIWNTKDDIRTWVEN